MSLPDHASERDERRLPIDQVGIRRLRYPITVWDRNNQSQRTVAEIAFSVGLPAEFKGTHMSRFIEVLQDRDEFSLGTVPSILEEVQKRLEAEDAYLEVSFPYFLERTAPVSGARSLMEYRCRFEANRRGPLLDFKLCVQVPVTTLCPCSKAVSKYGAHNQRGLVDIEARFDGMVWIEDIVEAVESCASSPLYALLKREDEKYVTEKAYENPRFVEDLVRDCAIAVRALPGMRWLKVSCENLESIHNHSAWASLSTDGQPEEAPRTAPREAAPGFGAWLRENRQARDMTQQQLATRLGLSGSLVSRIESGERPPRPEHLRALAVAWSMDPRMVQLRARQIPADLAERIAADPEGFLAWCTG
jgi:GTP cyclohydrolase IB